MLYWVGLRMPGGWPSSPEMAFIAVQVLVEDAIAAADGPLAVFEGIERKTEARRPVEEVAFVASARCAAGPARDFAVIGVTDSRHQRALYDR